MDRLRVVALLPAAWRQWKAVLEVAQLTVLDAQRRVVAQDRNYDPAATPVDVEPPRVLRILPTTQHVPPSGVLRRRRNAQVVRHDVDHEAQARGSRGAMQLPEALLAASITIQLSHISRVVAVVRPDGRLEQGREVDRADAEIGQVAGQGGRVVQSEFSLDLKTVGRGGDWHPPDPTHRHCAPGCGG